MKIAFATQDKQHVDAHFGWAKSIVVYEVGPQGHHFVESFDFGGKLEEDGDATVLRYTATADIGGKIAQLGSRLITSTANRLAGQFFKKFKDQVEGESVSVESSA